MTELKASLETIQTTAKELDVYKRQCAGKEAEPEPEETAQPPEEEQGGGMGILLVVLLVAAAGGGAFYYLSLIHIS